MPRAATTSDIFNAVAEPRRRAILTYLAMGEQSVGAIVDALKDADPEVRSHAARALGGGHAEPRPEPMPMPEPRPFPGREE